MECIIFSFNFFIFIATTFNTVDVARPPIVWDPYNSLFQCGDATIHVKKHDFLKFICPDQDISSNPNAQATNLHEKGYLLNYDDEEGFKNCNAAGGMLIFNCESEYKVTKYEIITAATYPKAITWKLGETYFVISTSYRTVENAGNLVGGSCNTSASTSENQFLKLKIYVCTEDDIAAGRCNLCSNEGCFYKSCGKTCGGWEYYGSSREESQCFLVNKRSCNSSILNEKLIDEFNKTMVDCNDSAVTGANTGSSDPSNDDADTYKFLSIGLTVAALIFGILIGVVFMKYRQNKTSNLRINQNYSTGGKTDDGLKGINNAGYHIDGAKTETSSHF